jgi:sirohydrochlorin cobaltochelatase
MSIASQLRHFIRSGIHRIGELQIHSDLYGYTYALCHWQDAELATEPALGGLDHYEGPDAARDLSTYGHDGEYRFAKGQVNLKRGWVMTLDDEEQLRQALDQFYPACIGLFVAQQRGDLDVQNLRDKLNRQTGMYRFARTISDDGAQELVRKVCGPAHQCAKKILWKIDDATPLADSEASRFNGIPGDLPENEAIPLLCREACNHFVAECRKRAKAEFEAKEKAAS